MSPISQSLRLEEVLEELEHRGRGGVPPWPPFSITAQSAIVGWSTGCVGAEPGLVEEQAGSVAGKLHDLLGRARLAGDRDREVAEHGGRGAVRGVRRVVEPLADHGERRRVDAALLRRRRLEVLDDGRCGVLPTGLLDGGGRRAA